MGFRRGRQWVWTAALLSNRCSLPSYQVWMFTTSRSSTRSPPDIVAEYEDQVPRFQTNEQLWCPFLINLQRTFINQAMVVPESQICQVQQLVIITSRDAEISVLALCSRWSCPAREQKWTVAQKIEYFYFTKRLRRSFSTSTILHNKEPVHSLTAGQHAQHEYE